MFLCDSDEEIVLVKGENTCMPACADGFNGIGAHCYKQGCPEGMIDENTHCLKPESYLRIPTD